jgi:hypothetical protein
MTYARIYFVGGASASGKSVSTKALAKEFCVNTVNLDEFYNVIRKSISDETLSQKTTKDVAALCVDKFLSIGAAGILEGGWVAPSKAAEISKSYRNRFCPVYCGYPKADIITRLEMIVRDGKHWLASRSQEEARNWLKGQIEGSLWYQSECLKYGIPFFDFSDVTKGQQQLQTHYQTWHNQNASYG